VSVLLARLRLRPGLLPETDASQTAAPLAAVIAALVVAATVAVGMQNGPAIKAGEARLVLNGATAQIAFVGQRFLPVSGSPTLHAGDRIKVLTGEPELHLANNARTGLRGGSVVRIGAAGGPAITLEKGDALASGRLTVATLEANVLVRGTAKVFEQSGLIAGAYDGTVTVQPSDAPAKTVNQFRQVAVLGLGAGVSTVEALHVDENDRWDRRILGDVLDLDARLESFATGFDAQVPVGSGSTPGFYKQLIPSLEGNDITPEMFAGRSAGENLIGFTLVALDKGTFAERVTRIFGFRDLGARWGLVAADRGLHPSTVLDSYQGALGRSVRSASAPLPRLGPRPTVTTPTRPGSTNPTVGPTTTTKPTGPSSSTTTTLCPAAGGRTCNTVTTVANNLVNILTGLLNPTTTTTRKASGTSVDTSPPQPSQPTSGKGVLHRLSPRIRIKRR
jgi:hypothetical protein